MAPYYILVFAPLVVFSFLRLQHGRNAISLKARYKPVIVTFFVLLVIILSLRHISVGIDLTGYKYYFDKYTRVSFEALPFSIIDVSVFEIETGFAILIWLVGRFTRNFQWFLFVVALISVAPIARLYVEETDRPFLKYILFATVTIFAMLFSGLRQVIAISIGVCAYQSMRKRKIVPFVLLVILAFLFHRSAFILLALYPTYHLRIRKKHFWIIVPVFSLAFIFNRQIFLFLQQFLLEKYANTAASNTGAYTMLILLMLFVVFCFLIPDEKKLDAEAMGLRNVLLLSAALQLFAPIHSTAMRMNYYFLVFIPILIPKVIRYARSEMRQVAVMASYLMCCIFTIYYFINAYIGADILQVYPYVPFWRG